MCIRDSVGYPLSIPSRPCFCRLPTSFRSLAMSQFRPLRCGIACLVGLTLTTMAIGQAPLHQRIDQHIQKGLKDAPAPRAADDEFLRRVYLNLTGVIPSVDEAREYFADKSADKRVK